MKTLIAEQIAMLRIFSRSREDSGLPGSLTVLSAARRARSSGVCSLAKIQIIAAQIRPGTPARKKAVRQPYIWASKTRTMGARPLPRRLGNTACSAPALMPRRPGDVALIISDWLIGRIGPSDSPRMKRAAIRTAKPWATPVRKEHSENTTTVAIRKGLRLPDLSERMPTT